VEARDDDALEPRLQLLADDGGLGLRHALVGVVDEDEPVGGYAADPDAVAGPAYLPASPHVPVLLGRGPAELQAGVLGDEPGPGLDDAGALLRVREVQVPAAGALGVQHHAVRRQHGLAVLRRHADQEEDLPV
jgi:hypothetical protein